MIRPLAALLALALAPWADSAPEATGEARGTGPAPTAAAHSTGPAPTWSAPLTGRAPTVQGVGYAYPEDPSRGGYTEVPLPDLHGDGQRLDGRYVRVRSIRVETEFPTRSLGDGPDFRYEPTAEGPERCTLELAECAPFDAVNVYYHVDRMAREFWRDRMGIDPAFQADAVVHLAGNGAVADPARRLLQFRLGDTYTRNAAREDDIVYHEYSHLVTSSLGFRVDTTSTMEARAVNEGFADYFAASFTDDPGIGEYLKSCTPRFHCTGPEDDPDLRTLDTFETHWNWQGGHPDADLKYGVCTRYHEGDGKCKTIWLNTAAVYVWGMIWGSTLWDVREALGADVADRLVLASVRRLDPSRTDLESAAGSILEADAEWFGGQFSVELSALFAARGIEPNRWPWVGTESGEPAADRVDGANEALFPNPATGIARVHMPGVTRVEVFDAAGRTIDLHAVPEQDFVILDFSGRPPGTYWMRAWLDGTPVTRSIVVFR